MGDLSMSARGKRWGQRFVEEINKGKAEALAAMDQIYSPNVVYHIGNEDVHGLKNWKQWASAIWDAFPDINWTFDDRIAKGDKVVTRFTATGTHTDEFMGIPPTNKKVTWSGIEIFRRAGGQIVESWLSMDMLGLMQQLGALPTRQTEP